MPHKCIKRQSGMTLIEMSIAILIVGVMLGAAVQLYNQNRDQYAKKITEERMDYIVRALSTYAETNYRIPCPADPSIETARVAVTPTAGREPWRFGYEWGIINAPTSSTPAGIGNCWDNDAIGINDPEITPDDPNLRQRGLVPFQTLSIPSEYAKDGWGNYFTYAVSPGFTVQTDFADTGTNNDRTHQVHEFCRTQGWIVNGYPVNAPKARFCCARDTGVATTTVDWDIVLTNRDSGAFSSNYRNSIGTNYGPLNSIIRDTNTPARHRPATGNIESTVFVLISHGRNGRCAYLGNDTSNRRPCNYPEATNNDLDRNYENGVETTNWDDIVVWMNQFSLMAYNGSASCSLP
jgi:prepilin-type N-terminal cleavage/methylation domain-containing protein